MHIGQEQQFLAYRGVAETDAARVPGLLRGHDAPHAKIAQLAIGKREIPGKEFGWETNQLK
jgi:hypothetical protein